MHVFVTVSIFTVLLTVAKSHRMSSYQAEFSAGKTLPSYVKKIILSLHNNARRNVNPPAKNMLEMVRHILCFKMYYCSANFGE